MNALTDAAAASPLTSSAAAGTDASYAAFLSRAAALTPGSIAGADALVADIVPSSLPPSTFKPLAAAIQKSTGLDAAALLKQLNKARGLMDGDAAAVDGRRLASDPDPALAPSDVRTLAEMIGSLIRRRVHCPPSVSDAAALWIIGAWGLYPPSDPNGGPDIFPRLHLRSPTKRCGKSTLLEIVMHLVRRPIAATDVSEAAIYRLVDHCRPTLVIDEADQLFRKNPSLAGIVNSGYSRTGSVIRNVEVQKGSRTDWMPDAFPTFCAVALAGIGKLHATIEDRSIRVVLQRQPNDQRRARVSLRQLAGVRDKLAPQLMAHADAIGAAMAGDVPDASIPPTLNDRDADNWQPLLGIAALAGDDWAARARAAAVALCADSSGGDRGPEWELGRVVAAIDDARRETVEEWQAQAWGRGGRKTVRGLSGALGVQRPSACTFIPSDTLAAWLMRCDDSEIAGLRDIGAAKLRVARLLRPFGMRPDIKKVAGRAVRGYHVREIRRAWRKYRA